MHDYAHNRVPGGTYFFTVRLRDRGSTLLTDYFAAFGDAIRHARAKKPFHVDAWVVLPDHAHAIWTLPPGDDDCASRWRTIKIAFSKALRKAVPDTADVWEPYFLERNIACTDDYVLLVDYIHDNPVFHGHCAEAAAWPWTSYHRFEAAGWILPEVRSDVVALIPSPMPRESQPCPD